MDALKRSRTDLVFTNSVGGPNLHMLRIVKRVAKRAKLAGRVDDHKFRSTAITRWLRNGYTVPDVMTWVGHVSPTTILRYAAKVNVRKVAAAMGASSAAGD
jgi:integrase